MMFHSGGSWSGWEVAGMGLGMVIFLALIIWAVYVVVTATSRRHVAEHHDDGAERILDERLAVGEIDADEYQRLRVVLAARNSHDLSDAASPR